MKTIVSAALLALVATGCGWRKEHLGRDFGDSYSAAFAAQTQRARDSAPAEAVRGLDPQEAAIVSEKYRTGLAGESGGGAEESLILLNPGREQSRMPAPSVPRS